MLTHGTSPSSATSSITSADGTPLLVRRWPAASKPWAQMLNEPEGPQVVADVIAWLRAAVAQLARTTQEH